MKRLNWASTRDLGTYPELSNMQTVIKACIVIMHVALFLLLANNIIRLRPACTTAQSDLHFVIRYLKAKWLGQISLNSYILGRLQHDKVPVGYALDNRMRPMAESRFLFTFKLWAKTFVYTNIDDVYKDTNDVFPNATS